MSEANGTLGIECIVIRSLKASNNEVVLPLQGRYRINDIS